MTPEYIGTLIDYNYWARDRVLASAEHLSDEQLTRNLGSSFGSVLDTLIHIRFAEWIWYQRWQGESPSAAPDAGHLRSIAALRDEWLPLEGQIRALVGTLDQFGLSRMVDYKLLNGKPGTSAFWEMIVHVVNHGSYHRGSVATMMRLLTGKPVQGTDMITFFRERAAVVGQVTADPAGQR